MAFWATNFWATNFWATDYWSDTGDAGPPSLTGSTMINGRRVNADGTLLTQYFSDGTPLPGDVVFNSGIATSEDGVLYICPWPSGALAEYDGGVAKRIDGAMCVILAEPTHFFSGLGLSSRGEVCISPGPPNHIVNGLGFTTSGRLCVTNVS